MKEGIKNNIGLMVLIILFNAFAIFIWQNVYKTSITGDEPHYIVMADSISTYHTFEQTQAYSNEFKERKIFPPGFSSTEPIPNRNYAHAIAGSNGLYNVHNIGLPLIIAPVYKFFGITGVKIFMIFLSSLSILLLWKFLSLFTTNIFEKAIIIFSAFFAFPFLIAANQIYSDLQSGIISLLSIVWVIYRNNFHAKQRLKYDFLILMIIAYQPWLQIKFFAPALLSTIAIILSSFYNEKSIKKGMLLLLPLIMSISLLMLYNHYAFSNPFGPYSSGSMEISLTSFMVLLGLHLDQFQGIFLQNPIMFIGLLFLIPFIQWNWKVGVLTLFLYLSFIVPNAMHPNWYGGSSYAGRFAWASAVIFMIPTIFGLSKLFKLNKYIFIFIILISMLLQSYFVFQLSLGNLSLYSTYYNPENIFLKSIETFYSPLQTYFPSFFNVEWAFQYTTNYLYILLFLSIIYLGSFYNTLKKNDFLKVLKVFFITWIILIVLISSLSSFIPPTKPAFKSKNFTGRLLPSQSGKQKGNYIVAQSGTSPGFITYGPYIELPEGSYSFDISYISSENNTTTVGTWDTGLALPKEFKQLKKGYLLGTNDKDGHIIQTFVIPKEHSNQKVEIRNFYNGTGNLTIKSLTITKVE